MDTESAAVPSVSIRGRPFQPGQSGNPDGRPPGARGRFTEQFYRDLAATWASHGKKAMELTAAIEPAKFIAICASLIPRSVQLDLNARLPGSLAVSFQQVVHPVQAEEAGVVRLQRFSGGPDEHP